LAAVEWLVCDCDGVLTPGDLIYDETGKRLLRFCAKDGVGFALMRGHIELAVLSGRPTDIAQARLQELGVQHFIGSCKDKAEGLKLLAAQLGRPLERCAFVGDDLPDLPAFAVAGLRIAVADSSAPVLGAADWILQRKGGHGAIREVAEALLSARGIDYLAAFLGKTG
jgi:3-deoxy-D-manno-octulosonate 8-phosphate phosphatase (KDO 8-P phosphatase)